VDAVPAKHLEEFVIVTVVDMDTDDHGSLGANAFFMSGAMSSGLSIMRPVAPNVSAYFRRRLTFAQSGYIFRR
jgi:hypothetical protein